MQHEMIWPAVRDVLVPERVVMLEAKEKIEALGALVDVLGTAPAVLDVAALRKGIFHRESLMSTGIGAGVGVPHVRLPGMSRLAMAVGICSEPIADYVSLDGKPVRLIFMIAAGEGQHALYLRLLAALSGRLRDGAYRDLLLSATSPERAFELLTNGGGGS